MIHSMTAFARQESKGDWGALVWEIKTINHRYLECMLKLPDSFSDLEPALRELVKQQLPRGKIDISLRFKAEKGSEVGIKVNDPLLEQLISLNQTLKRRIGEGTVINTMQLLSWPDVIHQTELDLSTIKVQAIAAFEAAMINLIAMRKREGDALVQFIELRLQMIEQELQKVKQHLPQVLENHRLRVQAKLADVVDQLDPTRLEQELVIFTQRIDVEEELNRLANHVVEVRRCIQEGGPQGRRLDFLMQELNREANTLGSKAGNVVISNIAISLKVLIEQIREQVQNIE